MSHKSPRIAARIEHLSRHPSGYDPHYLGFFECFNAGEYYEAHDVLEELWLPSRGQPDDLFYKGLIQLAGAFVHFQKRRMGPGIALLKLAESNFARFPTPRHGLDLRGVMNSCGTWIKLASHPDHPVNPLDQGAAPQLSILPRGESSAN